jgi:hypothetical protein
MTKNETLLAIDALTRVIDMITRSRTLSPGLQDAAQDKLLELINSL